MTFVQIVFAPAVLKEKGMWVWVLSVHSTPALLYPESDLVSRQVREVHRNPCGIMYFMALVCYSKKNFAKEFFM